jgi:hypothetical protein
MLEENKRYADYVGLTPYLNLGYTGKGVKIGSGENWLNGGHGLDTYRCFKEFAPNAECVYIPVSITETENKFFTEGIPLIKSSGILGMWASLKLDMDIPTLDRLLRDVSPDFFCATAIGNDGTQDYSGICDAQRVYGIGAYTLMADPVAATPSGYSSVSDAVDFVMPGNIYVPNEYGYAMPQSGTSFADPFFMAVFAVMQEYFMDRLGHCLSADKMYQFFKDCSVDMSTAGKDTKTGWGRIKLPGPGTFDATKYGEATDTEFSDANKTQHFLTENDCYKANRQITPKGIMVHSLGVAQPDVNVFLTAWNTGGVAKCVHAFVAEDGVYQTLPWNWRGWHAGGAANNTHIGFEICEPSGHTYNGGAMIGYDPEKNADYFKSVWDNAVSLCVMLCEQYGFDPLTDIICHSEGHALGVASNHADVMHWFPYHGQSMDTFRGSVKKRLEEKDMNLEEAKTVLKTKAGLSDATVTFLLAYRWGDELVLKLAAAMK